MKKLYKIVLFFAIIHLTALIVAVMGIFPPGSTLYSDIELEDLEGKNPSEVLAYLFLPTEEGPLQSLTFKALYALFVTGTIALGIISRGSGSVASLSLVVVILTFVPMLLKSTEFINKLFTNWNVTSLTYLGLTLIVGILFIVVITIVEMPTHGRSGE